MSDTETSDYDYSTGVPRHHHSLYFDDGNLVFQVENAIFNVHRSFLGKYSTVIKNMFELPRPGDIKQATEESPLVLTGDSASSWETLLESHYDSPSLSGLPLVDGERLLKILPIAHKYDMEVVERGIIKQLESIHTTAGYVHIMIASQILDSKPLYDKALKQLRNSGKPDLAQAKRIGLDAYFAVMDQRKVRCELCSSPCICVASSCREYNEGKLCSSRTLSISN